MAGLAFLVVEDEAYVRRVLIRGLTSYGRVEGVGTCTAARSALLTHPFDGVVIDVALPDGSGLDLIDLARERCPGVCVLVVTGSVEHAVVSRVHELGARYLLKPVDAKALAIHAEETRNRHTARDRRTRVVIDRWAQDYDLSVTEVELLVLAVAGVPREDYATLRNVRPDTIRKQIQTLLRKTTHDTFELAVNAVLREALEET